MRGTGRKWAGGEVLRACRPGRVEQRVTQCMQIRGSPFCPGLAKLCVAAAMLRERLGYIRGGVMHGGRSSERMRTSRWNEAAAHRFGCGGV